MRIGSDIDGCIADFNSAYVDFFIELTGKNLFPEGYDPRQPPTWYYPLSYGYTQEELDNSFRELGKRDDFWFRLQPEPGGEETIKRLDKLAIHHDIYFLTQRPGIQSKLQTEAWLTLLGMMTPTVLITGKDKMPLIRGLKLDVYIDDRGETMQDYARQVEEDQIPLRLYLVDRSYNQEAKHTLLTRVSSVHEALDREGL